MRIASARGSVVPRAGTALVALCVVVPALTTTVDARAVSAAADHPNVVIIVVDDQRWDMIRPGFTPAIWNRLICGGCPVRGRAFTNAFVPNAVCCPSRVSILTGNHSHTTGVWRNRSPNGGFASFDDRHTIAVDFERAGYRTAMIGKYLNGYAAGKTTYVPPGWDRWFAVRSKYYNYPVTTESGRLRFGASPKQYVTRMLSRQARAFVTSADDAGEPFFLYYSFVSVHPPAIPDPRDVGRFDGVTAADTGTPLIFRNMLAAGYGVDRAVGKLLDVLPRDTVVVYLSDNGFLWGEHGIRGKVRPYNESIRIPMILRSLDGAYDPVAPRTDIVLNIDLRPTLTRAADVRMSSSADGKDWGAPTYARREAFPIHHYGTDPRGVPSYCGVRELRRMYARFADGTELLFDTATDPKERRNLIGKPSWRAEHRRLRAKARALCDPPPPNYLWP
jgi:N-acetylglucosamine-6-sulfatase